MKSIKVEIRRGNISESIHDLKVFVINSKNKILFSTNNDLDYIYPRSSIKILQAIPFISSGAADYFKINDKEIALSASSHGGEPKHIYFLKNWIKKININEKYLKCGVHNPLNLNYSNKLLLKGIKPNTIYNNCSGKHLGMISTSIHYKYNLKNYLEYNHPTQKEILSILEYFTDHNVKKESFAIDGCSAPQYSFPMNSLGLAMQKISSFEKLDFKTSLSVNRLLYCISKYPFFIGGTNRFDSELIKITKGRIFCKQGAEGVLLFSDMKNKYGGVLKVKDGNNRAIPAATLSLLKKIGSLNINEFNKLKKWNPETLFNHSNKNVGMIKC